jgi:hypothetical protein
VWLLRADSQADARDEAEEARAKAEAALARAEAGQAAAEAALALAQAREKAAGCARSPTPPGQLPRLGGDSLCSAQLALHTRLAATGHQQTGVLL